MRTTSLPIVNHTTSLDEALNVMRKAKSRGVVTSNGPDFELHFSEDIATARDNSRTATVGDLRGTSLHVAVSRQRSRTMAARSLSDPSLLSDLEKSGKKFGLVAIAGSAKKATIFAVDDHHISFVEPDPKHRPKKNPVGSGR